MHKSMVGTVAILVLMSTYACSDDGLDGPERERFEESITEVNMELDRADVTVYGSDSLSGAIIDRWISADTDFERLSQRVAGRELVVRSHCEPGTSCRARYDLSVARSTAIDVTIAQGDLVLSGLQGGVEASLERGQIAAHRLETPYFFAALYEGHSRLEFQRVPGELRLYIDDQASVTVIMPRGAVRCEFDTAADAISAGDVDCRRQAGDVIRVEPPDASVRFEVRGR